MTKQEVINEAKYEVENARLELLEICHTLRANGAIRDATIVEDVVAKIEEWQNK